MDTKGFLQDPLLPGFLKRVPADRINTVVPVSAAGYRSCLTQISTHFPYRKQLRNTGFSGTIKDRRKPDCEE